MLSIKDVHQANKGVGSSWPGADVCDGITRPLIVLELIRAHPYHFAHTPGSGVELRQTQELA